MARKPKAGNALVPLAVTFAAAYIVCALHDDYRIRNGEPDKCILPAARAVLMQLLGL